MRKRFQILHLRGFQSGSDQQDRVRPHRAGFDDLVRIDDEVFAQHRQIAGGARFFEVSHAALEELHVGEHGQAGRTVLFIRTGNLGRHEVFAQHAFRRARFLHFGNDGGQTGRVFRAQCADEIADVARRRFEAQCFERRALFSRADFFAFDRDDAVEDVAHECLAT